MAVLITGAFLVWAYYLRDFLLMRREFVSDAKSYYEHFNYFINNIARGVYPLWEPSRSLGVPVEFFMRRIGEYNPVYLTIILFNKCGLSFMQSYLFFLGGYYFLGMIGFYLLAYRLCQSKPAAFLAYLLLLFSSLGTRMFDSYILLTVVPLIWFFYFLVSFAVNPRRHHYLGVVFTLMVLMTTYIPFYFFTIVLTFLICFVVFYASRLRFLANEWWKFFKSAKIFVLGGLVAVMLSVIPYWSFYHDLKRGELILPERHSESSLEIEIGVGEKTVTTWGIEEDLAFATHFPDYHDFQFAIIYISIFGFVILVLIAFTNATRKFMFYLIWSCLVLLISSPRGTPIYDFLYHHIFYYKYFRNLHFFLWMLLLPVFVLSLSEQFKVLLVSFPKTRLQKLGILIFIILVHIGFLVELYLQGNVIMSSYVSIVLSLVFFVIFYMGLLQGKPKAFLVFLMLLVSLQPGEVYHYLSKNISDPMNLASHLYSYRKDYLYLALPTQEQKKNLIDAQQAAGMSQLVNVIEQKPPSVYMGVKGMTLLKDSLNAQVFERFSLGKILLYDETEWVDDANYDLRRIGMTLAQNKNLAFVSPQDFLTDVYDAKQSQELKKKFVPRKQGTGTIDPSAEIITNDSPKVKLVKFDINSLKLKTALDSWKFLVYNDSFYQGWEAFIDGKKVDLWRANIGFKGLWVPPGEHMVYLRYGSALWYGWHIFLLGIFHLVFWSLIITSWKYKQEEELNLGNAHSV